MAPEIAELLDSRELLHRPVPYRFPHCVRRRIEAVQLPQGYAVLGDAICSFDPAWGQGMSVAALEAVALNECLLELTTSGGDLGRALARYHRTAVHVVDRAWTIVMGEVFQYEGVVGAKPRGHGIAAAYLHRVKRVAASDPYVASAMARVFSLLDPPQSLIRPSVSLRVLLIVPARTTLRQGGAARKCDHLLLTSSLAKSKLVVEAALNHRRRRS